MTKPKPIHLRLVAFPVFRSTMIGKRFGRWTVIGLWDETRKKGAKPFIRCQCDCGKVKRVDALTVRKGKSTSCGCFRAEVTSVRSATHRMTGTPEHQCWRNMLNRCTNPKVKLYPHYGGRGIEVCERWREFEHFYADMGPRPTPKSQIDRRENNGNYTKVNCRWTGRVVNSRNKQKSLWYVFEGKKQHLLDICAKRGIRYHTVWQRLRVFSQTLGTALTPVKPRKSA